ncbi:MAG: ribonuclease BN, partial [Aquificota bacterium]
VYEYAKGLFPSHAELVFDKLLPIYEKRASGSLLSLALAYYFSLSFAKTLNISFGFVYRKKPLESEVFFWVYMPFLLVLYTAVLSLAVALLALSKSYLGSLYQRLTELLNFMLLFSILGMLYSSYFRPRRQVFLASAFVAFLLLLLNKLFSLIVVKLLSASPLYSVIGSPLLFLVWLYYSFFCLLLGVCFIRRLDEPL